MVGTTISHYKVLEKIGQGGMGEVYLAQDTTLDRKVALKFLPEELEQDSTARKRFLREAKSAAALDHPYICHIHEVGEVEGKSFISMEYVQGETLQYKLTQGPLPLNDALEKATEVAEALEEAHKQGIVHRDLKPSNIMLTPQGHVKVMDFGLAKRVTPVEGQEQEITTALTTQGSTLGTVPYMSPEQLHGQVVDTRSDIFSFGVVLYEMLAGVHPFKRGGQIETANAILSEPAPPLSRYTEDIPVLLQHTVKKMLAKEPDRRYQHIGDVRVDLEDLIGDTGESSIETVIPHVYGLPRMQRRWGWIVAAVLFAAALTLAVVHFREVPMQVHPVHLSVLPPEDARFSNVQFAVSPDGRSLAFVGIASGISSEGRRLWLRSLDSLKPRVLLGTDGANFPFWSPDSRFIGFFAQGKLKKISVSGGPPEALCDWQKKGDGSVAGGTWNRDGVILFSPNEGDVVYRVSAAGGMPAPVTQLDQALEESAHLHPYFLPDGQHFLYLARSRKPENTAIYAGSLDSQEVKRLLRVDLSVAYAQPGYLFFMREETLMVRPFDVDRLEMSGEAVPFIEPVKRNSFNSRAGFSVSETGVLAYHGGRSLVDNQLIWFDRAGKQLEVIGDQPGGYSGPQLSPDESRVAVSWFDLESRNRDIWLVELSRDITSRLTFDPSDDGNPLWSPDGSRIVFSSDRKGQFDLYQRVSSSIGTNQMDLMLS